MIKHILKVLNMAASLRDLGETVSNTTVMVEMLASLMTKYSTSKTVWDNVEPDRQNLENLRERLVREETRLNADDEAESVTAYKNYQKKNNKNKKSSVPTEDKETKDYKNVKCFRCHKKGHFARSCKNKNEQKDDDNHDMQNFAFVADKPVEE